MVFSFFLSPDPDRDKIRICKKRTKIVSTSKYKKIIPVYIIHTKFWILKFLLSFLGEVSPKPNQKDHLDLIKLLNNKFQSCSVFTLPNISTCGISRVAKIPSFITVVLQAALLYVQDRRFCVQPSAGFETQLTEFEPIYKVTISAKYWHCLRDIITHRKNKIISNL